VSAHAWAREHQKEQLEKMEEYLSKAEPAMAVHKAIVDYSAHEGIPEEISAMGRSSSWKKSPEVWEEATTNQIKQAKEKKTMAEQFLAATTHIPCGIYSLVSARYGEGE
jgi:hypothetical protein